MVKLGECRKSRREKVVKTPGGRTKIRRKRRKGFLEYQFASKLSTTPLALRRASARRSISRYDYVSIWKISTILTFLYTLIMIVSGKIKY